MANTIVVSVYLSRAKQFQADARAASRSIEGIGAAGHTAGEGLFFANTRAFLWNQTMFTLRRVIYGTTLAMGALTASVFKVGFGFSSAMEQSQISMTQFLGSARLATNELNYLFELAAKTPFSVENIRAAATSFLGFGFSLKQTNRLLVRLGDTVAALPVLGPEGLGRIAFVFGQIRASGRLLGQDLRQLQQTGIPVLEILRDQLGLSKAQMQALFQGQLAIPSGMALEALTRGLQARYGGLARKQAQTFQGLTSTAKDYIARLSATLTHPLFVRTESLLRKTINPLLTQLDKDFRKSGGNWDVFFSSLDRGVGANGRIVNAWMTLKSTATDVWTVLTKSVGPAFHDVWKILTLGVGPLKLLTGTLSFLAHHTTLLKLVLQLLIARMIFAKSATILWRLASLATGRDLFKLIGITKTATAATKLYTLWTLRAELATITFGRAAGKLTGLLLALKRIGPIAITIGLVWELGQKLGSGQGHSWLYNLAHDIDPKTGKQGILGRLVFGAGKLTGLSDIGGLFKPPGLAAGGAVTRGGWAMVGERGRELLNLPAGTRVQPLATSARVKPLTGDGAAFDMEALATMIAGALERLSIETADVNVDGRKLGEIAFRARADKLALA